MRVMVRRRTRRGNRSALFRGKHPSRWNFWEEGQSSSLLSLWLSCKEQFRLMVVEGWINDRTPLSFAFGTCMHWCLEQAYSAREAPSQKGCRRLVEEFESLWKKERPNAPKSQLQVQEMVYGLAEAVLPTYFKRWAGDFKDGKYPKGHNTARIKKWEGLETRFKIKYTYPDGKSTWICGTRDGLFRDEGKYLRLFDTKCRSVISEEDTIDTLPSDLQQMLYNWATLEQTKEAPAGTLMNIVRRPGHRRGKEESLREFFERVRKDVEKPNRWDHYFIRIEMDLTKKEILDWKRTFLDPLMEDFRGWWEGRHPHYTNPKSLISKYGRCGMFNAICFGNFAGLSRKKAGTILNYQTEKA